jgi:hypothetical protein
VGACDRVRPRLNERRPRLLAAALGAGFALASAAGALSAMAADRAHTIDASRALDAGPLPGAAPEIVMTPTPADPTPMVERSQWVFDLRWDRGDVWLVGVNPLELLAPQATPRVMGRFALELFEGPALIERVRFDFPLLGPPEPGDGGRGALPSFATKLRTRVGVVFPATRRGTRLELWDRATDRRWSLPWPPPAAASDAGTGTGTAPPGPGPGGPGSGGPAPG